MSQIQILVPYFLPDKTLNLYNSPFIYFGLSLSPPLLPNTKLLENLTWEGSAVYPPAMPFTKQVLKNIHRLNCWQGERGKADTGGKVVRDKFHLPDSWGHRRGNQVCDPHPNSVSPLGAAISWECLACRVKVLKLKGSYVHICRASMCLECVSLGVWHVKKYMQYLRWMEILIEQLPYARHCSRL